MGCREGSECLHSCAWQLGLAVTWELRRNQGSRSSFMWACLCGHGVSLQWEAGFRGGPIQEDRPYCASMHQASAASFLQMVMRPSSALMWVETHKGVNTGGMVHWIPEIAFCHAGFVSLNEIVGG